MKRYINYLFVLLFIGAVFLASYSRRQHNKDTNSKLLTSLSDSLSKDSIIVSVGVHGENDTIVYNEGVFIRYPKKLKIEISVSKSSDIKRQVVVYDSIYSVKSYKGI